MNEHFEKYVHNIEELSDAMVIQVPAGASEGEAISIIQQNALTTHVLHEENDKILKEFLFSKKPEELTPEDIADINEFAQALINLDKPVAYLCYKLLHDYAAHAGDKDLLISTDYFLASTIFYLRYDNADLDVFLFLDRVAEHFKEAEPYFKDYESFENPATRKMLLLCYVERRTVSEYFDVIGAKTDLRKDRCRNFEYFLNRRKIGEQTLAIAYDDKFRKDNIEIPWDRYVDICHLNNTLFTLDMLRDSYLRRDEYNAVADACLKGQSYILSKETENADLNKAPISMFYRFRFALAQYHAGLIHANDLIATLLELYNERPHDDITTDGFFTNLEVPSFIIRYRKFLDKEGVKKYGAAVEQMIDGIYDYLKRLPRGRNINEMNDYFTDIILSIAQSGGNRSKEILRLTLASHPPTYIHSLMVAWLCKTLFFRIAETDPESLRGITGIEYAPAIRESRQEIAKKVYRCGLYHDIGKCMIIEHVGNYTRRLTDEEFAIIKLHPLLGSRLLGISGMSELEAHAALHHHRTYDRKGGYPFDAGSVPRSAESIVDIISVADCLDAETDNIGRCYAASKTVDMLIEELKKGGGTRYAPYVVKIFDDEEFCKKLKRKINRNRRRIYTKIYSELSMEEK